MGVFSKNDKQPVSASETTTISVGARVEGMFNCLSRLHIDGDVSGQIISNSVVIIGKKGKVKGQIDANKLIISGIFEGDANCDVIEILSEGVFKGKVISKELMIEPKARFEGESKFRDEKPKDNIIEENLLNGDKS